jgi:malonyl-CoA decarboxylase
LPTTDSTPAASPSLVRLARPASNRAVPRPVEETRQVRRVIELCHALLSEPAEASRTRLAAEALAAHQSLNSPALDCFFDLLVDEFSLDGAAVTRQGDACRQDHSHARPVQGCDEAPRRELFRRLTLASCGTAALVELRRRILQGLGENPTWAAIEADLAYLLRSWFSAELLEFRRIDGRTSPAVLESLIKYEAVHEIRDWPDLRRRLEKDRRCFALFHPSLPDEPVIFMELALTSSLSARVQPLLDPDSAVQDPTSCRYAMFYSISTCHEGLRGVSFGNALISRAVDALRQELPGLDTFATISPVPGFRPWLTAMARDGDCRTAELASLVSRLKAQNWFEDAAHELQRALVPLCAFYLLHAKRGHEPADSVARFHLGNGARLERLNWLGDTSAAGIQRSIGVTANYLYGLSEVGRNQRAYVTDRTVTASRRIRAFAKNAGDLLPRRAATAGR